MMRMGVKRGLSMDNALLMKMSDIDEEIYAYKILVIKL